MAVTRIKCTECDNLILPETAQANGGLCGQCVRVPEQFRRERREFEQILTSGSWFAPSSEEWNSAKVPVEFENAITNWKIEPANNPKHPISSIRESLLQSAAQARGDIFLVAESGARLNLAFNENYGVCEYQNEESGEYLYAYSPTNLRAQVAREMHVAQACPCCGVGMFWFPSRFHMPRTAAFKVLTALALHESNQTSSEVSWLESGDFTHTQQGRG